MSPERGRWPDQRGVARRSTEVVVVRQLGIRLKPEVRHVGWELPSPCALTLLVELRLGHPIVGVILCSWGVGIADGGAYLRDVVAVTCGREIGSQNGVFYLSIIMDIGQLPLTLIKSGVAILKEKDESYNLQVEN